MRYRARELEEMVPLSLQELPQWVAHTGRKVPICPATGDAASVTDPRTWGSFEVAIERATRADLGVGFVFTADDPFVGLDFDGVRDEATGEITPWAFEILSRLASFAEISPSGRGVHAILRAKDVTFAGGAYEVGEHSIEIYRKKRYFTVTGDLVRGFAPELPERSEALRELLASGKCLRGRGDPRSALRFPANLPVMIELFRELGVSLPEEGGRASCPFHNDRNPSLYVSERGWKCFSTRCGAGGGGAIALRRLIADLSVGCVQNLALRTGAPEERVLSLRSKLRDALREEHRR